jgi:AraC-like DNA-binding protein
MSSRPDMSISQIALDSGFSSYAYYGKCFRRRFGMTPTEFRQSAGQR